MSDGVWESICALKTSCCVCGGCARGEHGCSTTCMAQCSHSVPPSLSLQPLFPFRTLPYVSYRTYRVLSYRMLSYRIVSYLTQSSRIVSYLAVPYRIVSYGALSYCTVWCRIISYRIVLCRSVSCRTVSYHTVRVVSYCFVFFRGQGPKFNNVLRLFVHV